MRIGVAVGVLLSVFGLTGSVSAQGAVLLQGGVSRQAIINTPVDVSQAIAPVVPAKPFSLSSFFPSFTMPTFPAKTGRSPYPSPSSLPGAQQPNAFQPLQPVLSTVP
jgi:hypothetical protein